MLDILKSAGKKSLNGHDGISGVALSYFRVVVSDFLANAFNKSVQAGIFYLFFKTAKVFPLFEKGAKDYCKKYRPRSSLSSLSKCYEKLMHFCFWISSKMAK